MITGTELALLAGLGGLLALDRTAFLQTMASRPLVASTLSGYVMGTPETGLLCGCLLEMLWLMDLPVGAALPPNETLAALLAAPFAASAPPGWSPEARAALGVLASLPFGYLGRWVDGAIRRWNGNLLAWARGAAARGGSLAVPHLAGAMAFFAAGVASVALGAWLGCLVLALLVPVYPGGAGRAFGLVGAGLSVVGVAVVLSALRSSKAKGLFTAGFAGALLLEWAVRPLRAVSRGLWRP